ncbi:MAG: metallophosphoesterase [Acidobacteriota bacterium]
MIAIVSDLHMTDRERGAAIAAQLLWLLVEELDRLRSRYKRLELVLLGDVIDFLRSEKWDADKTRPWRGLRGGFEQFSGSPQEATGLRIVQDVCRRYEDFHNRLTRLKASGEVHVRYVAGNHDYITRLSRELREVLCEFLFLDEDPARPFPIEYAQPQVGLVALHGSQFDPMNCHREMEGIWPIGDAIVTDIVNRFEQRGCDDLHLRPGEPLCEAVQEVDNVVPVHHVPCYVHWLAESGLFGDRAETLKDVWRGVVDDFARFAHGEGLDYPQGLRLALEASKAFPAPKLANLVSHLFARADFESRANEMAIREDRPRIIVFGHTHDPGIRPLPKIGSHERYYVNTGSWRRVRVCPGLAQAVQFASLDIAGMFLVFEEADDAPPGGRFHLISRWHLT